MNGDEERLVGPARRREKPQDMIFALAKASTVRTLTFLLGRPGRPGYISRTFADKRVSPKGSVFRVVILRQPL